VKERPAGMFRVNKAPADWSNHILRLLC
jgi:hypothetical protein